MGKKDARMKEAARFFIESEGSNAKHSYKTALLKAGFLEEEIKDQTSMKKLKAKISSAISKMRKQQQNNPNHNLPNVLHDYMAFQIRLLPLSKELKLLLPTFAEPIINNIEKKDKCFVSIKNTNDHLKQWSLILPSKINWVKDMYNECTAYFNTCGFDETIGIQNHAIRATALYTANRDYSNQAPHTDYALKIVTKENSFLAWTAHMPVTRDGSWIHVWTGPGYSTPIFIEYGFCLFLRSETVHAGGRPMVDNVDSKYPRLHFYLPTKFQGVPSNQVFYHNCDGKTRLDVMHFFKQPHLGDV